MDEGAKRQLRTAFRDRRLTLYLGAGVSAPSGLPTWQRLVLAMYFDMLREENHKVYVNYLHAIAEWMLEHSHDPLEITAQKIRLHFGDDENAFLDSMRRQLYAGFQENDEFHVPSRRSLRKGNATLTAVANLIERGSIRKGTGVEAVVTYNYDNLLELALLERVDRHVVCRSDETPAGRSDASLPIFHVHGYVPLDGSGSSHPSQIIFTEEQYYDAANVAYSWSNLVQIRGLSSSTGLMVGLSLADRNIRRLLHSLSRSPVRPRCFAALKRPTWEQPNDHEEEEVHLKAKKLYHQAEASGSPVPGGYGKKREDWHEQIRAIMDRVHETAIEQQERLLRDLGVEPIWYDDHDEVPALLGEIGT